MASGSRDSGGIPFIVSTGTNKPGPEMRKFIRSHVMIGKNRGKTLRPKYEKVVKSKSTRNADGKTLSSADIAENSPAVAYAPVLPIPRKVGSELSLIRFADNIEEPAVTCIMEFSSIAKKALFPLESCVNFGPREKGWVEALTVDAAYLHAMAFSAQAYFDLLAGRSTYDSPVSAYPHVVKTLRLLRERLETPDRDTMVRGLSSTAAVVLCLAFHAHIMGDYQAVRHHMVGLRKIVDLKGGLLNLRGDLKLALEILRCDIGMAFHSGLQPLFFSEPTKEPHWPYPDFEAHDAPAIIDSGGDPCLESLDTHLRDAWRSMKQFAAHVNRAGVTHRKLPKELLLESMASIMYRLLHMSELFKQGSLDEAVRLGLLAFASSVFLQWAGVRLPYMHFPATYRDSLFGLDLSRAPAYLAAGDDTASSRSPSPQLLLWLLKVGAVSVFGDADNDTWLKPWLRVNIELCGVDSWPAMSGVLNSFMWVGLVHDKPGKAIFDSTVSLSPP
ncbi:hypothetical protein M426DRAFT_268086 [Hypoxylon sp. CI-4A]|nr:hypothetical protein M426DRAFT_268086 [Hypoxylon sp. CI-4A]